MASLADIKNWFRTGLKPTQTQFWATWDSFWHKDSPIPQSAVQGLEESLINKVDVARFEEHINNADLGLQEVLENGSMANVSEQVHIGTSGGIDFSAEGGGVDLLAPTGRIGLFGNAITASGNQYFKGIEYFRDHSAEYTDRSLVDKGYVDNAIGTIGGVQQIYNASETTRIETIGKTIGFTSNAEMNENSRVYIEAVDATGNFGASVTVRAQGELEGEEDELTGLIELSIHSKEVALNMTSGGIYVTDNINQGGIRYAGTFTEAHLTDDSYVPSVGTVKALISEGGAGNSATLQSAVEAGHQGILEYDIEAGEDSIILGRRNMYGGINGIQVYQSNTNILGYLINVGANEGIRIEAPEITNTGHTIFQNGSNNAVYTNTTDGQFFPAIISYTNSGGDAGDVKIGTTYIVSDPSSNETIGHIGMRRLDENTGGFFVTVYENETPIDVIQANYDNVSMSRQLKMDADINFSHNTHSMILCSQNGAKWKLTVSNDGTLSTTSVS